MIDYFIFLQGGVKGNIVTIVDEPKEDYGDDSRVFIETIQLVGEGKGIGTIVTVTYDHFYLYILYLTLKLF